MDVISRTSRSCPLCGELGEPDARRPVEIAGLAFESVLCDRIGVMPGFGGPNTMPGHVFPERWLESEADGGDELVSFTKGFAYVRPPFEPGSAIAEAFGDSDARLAWVQHTAPDECGRMRVLIRL